MFAAALSGMRAAETADESRVAPIDFKLVPGTGDERGPERDWRNWVGSDFSSFEEGKDCPIFFQKDVPGFGTLRITAACNTDGTD